MRNYLLALLSILLIIQSSVPISVSETTPEPSATADRTAFLQTTLYVDDDNTEGPWNGTLDSPYQTINQALENATDQDTIYVFNGLYPEYFEINKQITLQGEQKESTIIDGTYHEFIIKVVVPKVTIQGFTIRNSAGGMTDAALKLTSQETVIKDCIFYRTKTGISLKNTNHHDIRSCLFYQNGEGIGLYSSSECVITSCYFTRNALGVSLDRSSTITLDDCYAQTNGIGYYFYRSSNCTARSCAAYDNNDNQGGFFLKLSTNITITDCNSMHNGVGIRITDCASIHVTSSTLNTNTHAAVWIDNSHDDILVQNCEMNYNKRFAAILGDTNCTFTQNNIYNSIFGIYGENSICDARRNWWGSLFGPALFDRAQKDRVQIKNGTIRVFLWRLLKVSSAGASWEINKDLYHVTINTSRYQQILIPDQDTDADMVPDWWETKYGYDPNVWDDHSQLDPDEDGLNNIEECYTDQWGSHPFSKDLFLEIDWMESQTVNASNKPSMFYLRKMIRAFKNHNITLHVDTGNLNGGEQVTYRANFSFAMLRDYYWNYFLHGNLNNPRKGIFHYCLVSDYGPSPGFAFVGWDQLDSFQISAQTIANKGSHYLYPRGRLIVGGIIHELGHTLGLNVDDYGGIDNKVTMMVPTSQWWQYRSYHSCMNYWYTYTIFDFSDGSERGNEFNDWDNMDYSFFKNTSFEDPIYDG